MSAPNVSPEKDGATSRIPKSVSRVSDLPAGRVIDDGSMNLRQSSGDRVVVFAPTSIQSKDDGVDVRVWVLMTAEYQRTQMLDFFEIRKRLQKAKVTVMGQVQAPESVIKALYENASVAFEQKELHKGDLREYYEEMISYALRESVSDIHIEKRSSRSTIRMRKHGQLIGYDEPSNVFADRLCRVIYTILAENQDVSFREDIFQAASVNTVVKGEEVKLRYQSLPAYPGGFDVVLRVLPLGSDEATITPLESLGYSSSQVKMLLDIASRPVGALVIAGTTGSGKSTTLKNLLMYVNDARQYRCKIFTIEDPPEYKIPFVTQVPVVRREQDDPSISPFLAPLKATMRGDPDLLMIGEVRDIFTGDGLKKATQSGHQVMTTVHATSALGIVPRLADFSITPSVMGSEEFLNGLIFQKLLPKVCQACCIDFNERVRGSGASRVDLELARRLERVADMSRHVIRVRGQGCEKCNNMGIVGRTVCAEIIVPDLEMLDQFTEQNLALAKYYWRSQSDQDMDSDNMTGKTVLEHALFKMRQGEVCPYDIEEIMGPVDAAANSWVQMQKKFGKEGAGDL
jgi:type II secretory ATPase GspE/PulE/Tfp pilus assembly ATPase PilB-like protein